MKSKLIGLIAMFAVGLGGLLWLPGIIPTARGASLDAPSFSDIVKISENPGHSTNAKIAGKNGLLYVVWEDWRNIFLRRLWIADGKPTFDPIVNVTDIPPNEGFATSPQIATDSDDNDANVYVAWTVVTRTAASEIWFKRSTDGGHTFGPATNISRSPGTSFAPRLAVAGKHVFVAWGDFTDDDGPGGNEPGCFTGGGVSFDLLSCRFSIYVAASHDGGETFGAPVNVSGRPSANDIPAIAATRFAGDAAAVFVTWSGVSAQGPGVNVFFLRSADSGVTWALPAQCGDDPRKLNCTTGFSKHPQVAASANGDVYVAWAERPDQGQDGDEDIHIVVGHGFGSTFGQEFNLSHNPGVSDYPEFAISPGGVQVIWHDGSTGVMDVFHSRSTNGGQDYSEARSIGLSQRGFTYRPRVATSGNNVHVVWSDGSEIFYALSGNNGQAFDLYQMSQSFGGGFDVNALRPRLTPSGSSVSAVWDEGVWEPLFTLLPAGQRDIQFESTLPGRSNLALRNLEAVQAPLHGRTLAKGKPTVLWAVVQNQFNRTRVAKLKLNYQTLQGGVPTLVTRTESVTLSPGINTLFLPTDSVILPSGTEFHATATVDPDHEIEEVDEQDNTASITVPVKDTGDLRVMYMPLGLATESQPTPCDQVRRVMDASHRFMRAAYPIEPGKLHSDFSCAPYIAYLSTPLDVSKLKTLLKIIESFAKLAGADMLVGVVPEGWFKANAPGIDAAGLGILGPDHRASIVEAQLPSEDGSTTAHEVAHNLGWVPKEHPAEDLLHPTHVMISEAKGYWVTERRELKGIDFMRFAPVRGVANWTTAETYDFLTNALIRLNQRLDPKVILLRGDIGSDGAATLDPWYRFESLLDLPLGSPGAYTVAYFDGAGQPLGETGFDLSAGEITHGGGPLDTVPFSLLIPDIPGARKIVLKKGTQVLAERAATPSSPTVKVLSPNGGERFAVGDTVKVTWESADADGDALKHAVMFSRDAGQTWLPLVLDQPGHEFSFTVHEADASKDARVRVLVTDGFFGTEDSSDAGFSIGGASHGLTFGPSEMLRDNVTSYPIVATARTAASGDNVYAVWSERICTSQQGCTHAEIFFRRSTDRGISFEPVVILSTNSLTHYTPVIVAAGNNVYVVWNEAWNQGAAPLVLRRSSDGGATFDPAVTVTTNGGGAQIAAAGDSVYVVWETSLPTSAPYPPTFQQLDVLFRASMDRGASFGPTLNLSETGTRDSKRPQVVAAASNVYVAWHEGNLGDNTALGNVEIQVRRSINGGTTFDPAVNLGGNALPVIYGTGAHGIADTVRLAATGNELYLVWRDYTNFKASIDFTRSLDAGATFAPVVALSSPSRSPWWAQLAVSAGQVYVAWSEGEDPHDQGTGMMDVLFRASADGGASFGAEAILSTSQGRALFPHLVAQGDTVDLIWHYWRPSTGLPWEVVFRQSTDRGRSFGPAMILGTEQVQVGYPQLAVTPENVYATWLGYYGYPTNSRDYRYLAFRAGSIGVGDANRAPAANAGSDRTVTEGSVVVLLGLGSDLDGDKLAFSWQQTSGPAVTLAEADTATAAFTAPVGSAGSTLTFQLTVDDGKLQSAPSEIRISVTQRPPITNLATQAPFIPAWTTWEDRRELPTPVVVGQPGTDTTPPITSAVLTGTLGSNGWYKAGEQARLTLAATDSGSGVASTSYATNGGPMQNYSAPVVFTDGTYTVTYRSVDKAGNIESLKSISFKVDQTAPTFSTCAPNPPQLWPANHKMVNVTVSVAITDGGSGATGFVLKSATSNEPDNGLGDGDTPNDIQGFEIGKPDTQGQFRAERAGPGNARVYTLAYQALDAAGNAQTCTATAKVDHDQGATVTAQSERLPGPNSASAQGSPSKNLAAPIIFRAVGPIAVSIQGAVDAFRSALGRNNGNEAGPLPTGRREIDWDGGGNNRTTAVAGNPFHEFEISRGALFTTPNGIGFVQAPPAADPVLFPPGGLAGLFDEPAFGTHLRTFSSPRLFSAIESNITEVDFVVPGGGGTPATTRGFGAVFTNVGEPDGGTLIEYFGADGTLLFSSTVPTSPGAGGLSFFGIVFDDAGIAWVRITSGVAAPGPDDDGNHNSVLMDDFIYSEPQALP